MAHCSEIEIALDQRDPIDQEVVDTDVYTGDIPNDQVLPDNPAVVKAITRAIENARQLEGAEVRGLGDSRPETEENKHSRLLREATASDREGTYPGTSPSDMTKGHPSKGNKTSNKFYAARRTIETTNPSTTDQRLLNALRNAQAFMRSINIDPNEFLPDHLRHN